MATIGFGICLVITLCVAGLMIFRSYENVNTYYWTLITVIPIVILGYWLKTMVTTVEAAKICFCMIYLDSTLLLTVMIFAMLRSLRIDVNPWIKVVAFLAAFLQLGMIWTCVGNDLYYATMTITETANGNITKMTSGPLKIYHTIYLAILVLAILGIIIASFLRKGTFSRRVLYQYTLVSVLGILVYVIESAVDIDFSLLPYLYVFADVMIALNYDHEHMHDISCLISEQQKYYSNKGYVAFDLQGRFLSCNNKAYEFIPELEQQIVDQKMDENGKLDVIFGKMIEQYVNRGINQKKFQIGDMTCICEISQFSIKKGGKVQGYLFDLRDATEEQRTMDIMTSYNEHLNAEVKAKTENIAAMQQKVVIGMANIIENRDNNTGGHVKRTSDVIQIIVAEIMKQGKIQVGEQLGVDIVRAAPMHDLGKVSIDSNILCKPGRLNEEEYAIMKTHSAKSGEMVKILLEGVEEDHFVETAFNIARYHHERWDGKGYPDGLVGSMIPLEARIMAIADVYDALVSKRCYKEAMSFEKASEIMCEGMGTQFDPNMLSVFLGCRDQLEAYYRIANNN